MSMSANRKYGRVFDGKSFTDVDPPPSTHGFLPIPVPPTARHDSSDATTNDVFVSIPQFRDGRRCGRTLKRLFDMAKYPNRVYVGLIEQTDPDQPDDDPTCLQEYCALLGHNMWTPKEMEEESGDEDEQEKLTHTRRDKIYNDCPRVASQIRSIRFSHLNAKGPAYARSFVRKLVGNEEYCMQIDAAADFTKYWDELAIQQWSLVQNEYAILSNVPERDKNYGIGGMIGGEGSVAPEVPRQCAIKVGSEGVPLISSIADGKAVGLVSPLLTTGTYSSSFTFAKCHLETNVPYDPFAAQLIETEVFPHYARLWTRGYDVYTPAINLLFRDNAALHPLHHEKGHGETGERKWPKNDLERRDAHVRMKVLLNIHHGVAEAIEAESVSSTGGDGAGGGGGIGERIETARANLGIYGLGKRRTLEQLLDFVGISVPGSVEYPTGRGNNDGGGRKGGNYCANPQWVPYDASISPRANLYDGTGKADDCDPEPVFALRTLPDAFGEQYDHPFAKGNAAWGDMILTNRDSIDASRPSPSDGQYLVVVLLWVIGLCAWYCMCIGNNNRRKAKSRGVGKQSSRVVLQNSTKESKRKDPLSERVLKDV